MMLYTMLSRAVWTVIATQDQILKKITCILLLVGTRLSPIIQQQFPILDLPDQIRPLKTICRRLLSSQTTVWPVDVLTGHTERLN